jgi:hypothetical protein
MFTWYVSSDAVVFLETSDAVVGTCLYLHQRQFAKKISVQKLIKPLQMYCCMILEHIP